jgi:hypothetical protein
MKHLKNIKYCSIGIQTDRNVAYHPLLYAKREIWQSSFSQPVMHSDIGSSHMVFRRLLECVCTIQEQNFNVCLITLSTV